MAMTTKGSFLPPNECVADNERVLGHKRLKYLFRESDSVIEYPVGSGGLPVEDKGAIAKCFVKSTALSLTIILSTCLCHSRHVHEHE